MVAQHREAEHHYDVIEPKAVLSNLEQFSLERPPGLLVESLSQRRGQDTHILSGPILGPAPVCRPNWLDKVLLQANGKLPDE
jgi:hypothetical protein